MPEERAIDSSGGGGKVVGRIILYTVLAALLGLGLWEFMQTRNAKAFGEEVNANYTAAKKDGDVTFGSLKLDKIDGAPDPEIEKSAKEWIYAYKFSGLLRTNEIKVYVTPTGKMDTPESVNTSPVRRVEGPGITLDEPDDDE